MREQSVENMGEEGRGHYQLMEQLLCQRMRKLTAPPVCSTPPPPPQKQLLIRRRRPTPATLVLTSDQSSPAGFVHVSTATEEGDEDHTHNERAPDDG
ncbi:hypothetical protein CB1_000606012 [Camelus ferus]|nr:hypothetical protein CB1_000606012 [Camelus ferus]